ncbi:MAG TPA: hypothetical protein VJN42_09725 [Candidatus Acidoferrum sp.]|nr:hypothetical protein [Candidatus Acidoferrum sp.]
MLPHTLRMASLVLAGSLLVTPAVHAQKKTKKSQKTKSAEVRIVNYYGGVFLLGEGGIPNGPCFRIHGRVTAGEFFDQLKAFTTDDGTVFRLGPEELAEFPDTVNLALTIRDMPCEMGVQHVGTASYLTREEMSSMKLNLYWKHGVEMRPAGKIAVLDASANVIQPYAKNLAAELPQRYLWSYELEVPSAGVPLTDSLVLIFRTAKGQIAARVAARL